MANHPSGELIGPSAPLEPNAGCDDWVTTGAEAAAAGPDGAAGDVSTADLLDDREGE